MTQHAGQSQRQTTEQLRAVQAWGAITDIQDHFTGITGKYGTLARGLPAMIQTNGLAVTAAFLHAKRGAGQDQKLEFARLYAHLSGRLQTIGLATSDDLMEFVRTASTDKYRRATAELITYATWLKRYAEAKGWKSSESD